MSRPERASIGDEVVLARGRGKRVALNGQPATVRAYKHGWATVSTSAGDDGTSQLPWRSGHWSAAPAAGGGAAPTGPLPLTDELHRAAGGAPAPTPPLPLDDELHRSARGAPAPTGALPLSDELDRAAPCYAPVRTGLLSLEHELLCAILEHVRTRPLILRAGGACRALRAAARAHSAWRAVELLGPGSLGELEAMCAVAAPLASASLTFGALDGPLVLHWLETCDTSRLQALTLRRVDGFHVAFRSGSASVVDLRTFDLADEARLEDRCRRQSVKAGVRDCSARLGRPGAGFLPLALAAAPHLISFTCSNMHWRDFADLPALPRLEVADLGSTSGTGSLHDGFRAAEPAEWEVLPVRVGLGDMPALTRLRLAGFLHGSRLSVAAPALRRLVLNLSKNAFLCEAACPALEEVLSVIVTHGIFASGVALVDAAGNFVAQLPDDFSFVPWPVLPESAGAAGVPFACGIPPAEGDEPSEADVRGVVELPAGCRVSKIQNHLPGGFQDCPFCSETKSLGEECLR